mmetsp:Transcript_13339/g.40439  ORF Transcript_13339/g.40439 Transcript_13339/m.40439 type:complete len:142 (+) Transcript_13339:580-1005(+)|eukprot:scaffold187459_cov28-Tisochrysis_lutea.AAC.2
MLLSPTSYRQSQEYEHIELCRIGSAGANYGTPSPRHRQGSSNGARRLSWCGKRATAVRRHFSGPRGEKTLPSSRRNAAINTARNARSATDWKKREKKPCGCADRRCRPALKRLPPDMNAPKVSSAPEVSMGCSSTRVDCLP